MHNHLTTTNTLLQHPTATFATYFCILTCNNLTTDNCNSSEVLTFLCTVSYCRYTADFFNLLCPALYILNQKSAPFTEFFFSGVYSNQKCVQKFFCKLSTHLCSQWEPSGTVQSEHPVARSNCPTAESKLFPSPPPQTISG